MHTIESVDYELPYIFYCDQCNVISPIEYVDSGSLFFDINMYDEVVTLDKIFGGSSVTSEDLHILYKVTFCQSSTDLQNSMIKDIETKTYQSDKRFVFAHSSNSCSPGELHPVYTHKP